MRQFVRLTTLVLVATAFAASACGGGKKTEEAQTPAQETAKQTGSGLEQMAKGFEQMAKSAEEATKSLEQHAPVDPVSFRDLQTVLPSVAGWEMGKPKGEKMTSPVPFSKSEASYERDDARVQVEIMDSGFNQMLIAPAMMMLAAGYERETDSGYEKGTKVGAYPAFERWDSDGRNGELNVVVNKRFIVKVEGNNIADPKVLREFAQAADLAKLAAMK